MARHTAPQGRSELTRGVAGNGATLYILTVFAPKDASGYERPYMHRFTTKSEAKAFQKTGTTYGKLEDFS